MQHQIEVEYSFFKLHEYLQIHLVQKFIPSCLLKNIAYGHNHIIHKMTFFQSATVLNDLSVRHFL